MGSNQFQREYIEYLQERNTELMGRLNHMKENYENKILSKDLKKHYMMSTLEDVLNICTQIPQEIDIFFEKMTAAMGVLKNILLRKSEMVQLAEKISKVINSAETHGTDLITVDGSNLLNEPMSESKTKKSGTVRVSPMINGHVISTEPRIYLSRVPEVFTPRERLETQQLSPIIEASPDISSDLSTSRRNSLRDITVPVERLNLKKMSFSFLTEESPKSRFKGPKRWKKSLSSTKHQSENQRNSAFQENKENLNKKITIGEIENVDPLEGPSWLYNENEGNPSLSCFLDYRRRKHRYATVFDNNEDYISSSEGKVLKLSQGYEDEDSKSTPDVDGDDGDEDDKDEGDNKSDGAIDDNEEEFSQKYTNTDDKREDVRKHGNVINESSEDLFGDSPGDEFEGCTSPPFKNKSSVNKRKRTKDDGKDLVEKDNIDSEKNFALEISTSETLIKKNKSLVIPEELNVSNKTGNDKHTIKKSKTSKKSRKNHGGAVCEGSNLFTTVKKTSYTSEFGEKKGVLESENNDVKTGQKNSVIKRALEKEVFVKLEDCMIKNGVVIDKLNTKSPSDKTSLSGNTIVSGPRSPAKSPEKEDRKRRKAAPTFKLVEPKLSTKLRRN